MRRIGWLAALTGALWTGAAEAATTLVNSRTDLGPVHVAQPSEPPRALVFLWSDRQGWTAELDRAAQRLAADRIAVVGIDLPRHLQAVARSDERDCHYLVSAVEDLSKRLQRQLHVEGYRSPILAGVGEGATLAYAALAQAPAATVEGAVTLDPAPALATALPVCAGAPFTAVPGGFAYGQRDDLPGWWRLALREAAPAWDFVDRVPAGERVDLPVDADLTTALVTAIEPAVREVTAPDTGALADLPIVPIEPQGAPKGLLAIILSGDGGWRDIDKQIGEWLAAQGVGVVGVDSLRYFWSEKPPETIARDLGRIADAYLPAFHARRVVLVGYSFGADVLPATWHVMGEADRERVVQLSLLGLSTAADFEFHVGGWLGLSQGARPVAKDAPALDPAKVQCFYGAEEDDTFCRDRRMDGVERIETKGGHHFDGDYVALARRILDGASRRLAQKPR